MGWSILLFIFSILRRKAWNHGHLALLKRISKRGSNQSRGEELLQEEEEAFDEAQQNNAGYNVWVSLFYDPDRRFSIAQPQRQYRIGNANSHPATPTGSNTPTPRGGWPSNNVDSSPSGAANALPNGALSSPLPNGGFSTPIQNSGTAGGAADHGASPATKDGATSADEVKIRIPPHLPVNATPSAATLLRGDGQLHTGNFNFSNPRGFFGWIPPIFKLKDKDYREVSGQDAVNYLNFQRYCIVYLGIVMLMSCGVIMPLNIHGNIQTKDDDFAKTTISNLPVAAGVVWVSSLSVSSWYLATFFRCYFLLFFLSLPPGNADPRVGRSLLFGRGRRIFEKLHAALGGVGRGSGAFKEDCHDSEYQSRGLRSSDYYTAFYRNLSDRSNSRRSSRARHRAPHSAGLHPRALTGRPRGLRGTVRKNASKTDRAAVLLRRQIRLLLPLRLRRRRCDSVLRGRD